MTLRLYGGPGGATLRLETRFLEITFTNILLEFPKRYSCSNVTFSAVGVGDLIIMFASCMK